MKFATKMTAEPQPNPDMAFDSLPLEERKTFMREKFSAKSRFQREFDADNALLDCATYSGSLRNEVLRVLAAKGIAVPNGELENLHRHLSPEWKKYGFDDGVNRISTLLYDADAEFLAHYHAFIKEAIGAHFPYPFYFQATPTVRIHCPDGENNHHYPRYHTDIGYGHPPEEINIWIPLTQPVAPQSHGFRRTDVAHSQAILEEFDFDFAPFIARAVEDKRFNASLNDIAPQVNAPFGKMTAFDSRCIHTGEPLLRHTRASIDIRIIPVADFETLPFEYRGSGRRKMRYVPGQGYYPKSSHEL